MKPLITVSSEMSEACQTAVDVWGQSEQLTQSMGECGEYIAEVGRHFQGRDPELEKVTDEAADVIILIMQVRELVGGDRFDEALAKKFDKFLSKVSKEARKEARNQSKQSWEMSEESYWEGHLDSD